MVHCEQIWGYLSFGYSWGKGQAWKPCIHSWRDIGKGNWNFGSLGLFIVAAKYIFVLLRYYVTNEFGRTDRSGSSCAC